MIDQTQNVPNPYIMNVGIKTLSSNTDDVIMIENEFREALIAHTSDMNLMYEAWDAYTGFDNGVWDKKKLLQTKDQNRVVRSFDIIAPKVDILAGAIVSELPDIDWQPVEGQKTSATEAIKDSWLSDKELTNSEYEMMLTIRDGLVHIGWCQLVESNKYGKPTIGVQRILPGFFVPSGYWVQESDRHLEIGYKIGYLTPLDMKSKYKAKNGEIEEAIRRMQKRGRDALPSNAYEQRRRFVGQIADHYKVIEKHYVEHVETTRLIGAKVETEPATGELTGLVRWVPFPLTQNRGVLEHFAAINNIDWETVEETPYSDTIHKVKTVVPDFDRSIMLEDAKSKIQTKGLPFYHFTVSRYNGRNKGIVAAMLDPVRTMNERESMVTELISKANGGARIIDEAIFKGPDDKEDFRANANNPSYNHFADLSQSNRADPVIHVNSNQYPSQVIDQIKRIQDNVIPVVSRVSDSLSAVSEPGKAGILFEKEIQVNQIGNLLMNKGVKQMLDSIGEGYFFQWQIAYAGIEREITAKGGKQVMLNERFRDPSTGKEMIRNAVGYVPRCRALVTESPNSATYQMKYRLIYSEMLKNINAETQPDQWNYIFNNLVKTLGLPDKETADLEAMNRKVEVKGMMSYVQQIMTIHAGTKMASVEAANADLQLQAIMQQLQASGVSQQPAMPAVPEQLTDATEEVTMPAGPVEDAPVAMGSDVIEE